MAGLAHLGQQRDVRRDVDKLGQGASILDAVGKAIKRRVAC
jgi:hypothetical protein